MGGEEEAPEKEGGRSGEKEAEKGAQSQEATEGGSQEEAQEGKASHVSEAGQAGGEAGQGRVPLLRWQDRPCEEEEERRQAAPRQVVGAPTLFAAARFCARTLAPCKASKFDFKKPFIQK